MSRPIIRWDAESQEWTVYREGVSVGAFSKLYEAERYECGDAVIDLDDVGAEVDR